MERHFYRRSSASGAWSSPLATAFVQEPGLPPWPPPSSSSQSMPKLSTGTRTPRLVRGRSGVVEDDESLCGMVADVLEGWAAVDRSTIQIRNMSCEGEGSVYKISAKGAEPPAVALHRWGEDADAVVKQRTASAAELFARAGLSPPRLAHGGDWFIEPWTGTGKPTFGEESIGELGELVARIHQLPIDWFEAHRKALCDRSPELCDLPANSYVWPWTSRQYILADMGDECRQAWSEASFLVPETALAARAVTAHADCHAENMLQTSAGIQLIDFEWSCVTCAAHDLCFVIKTCCNDDLKIKVKFIEAYANACGIQASPADVERIIFDCEVFFLATHCGGPLELWMAHDQPEQWLQALRTYEAFVASARMSPHLRQEILKYGIVSFVEKFEAPLQLQSPLVMCAPHGEVHERFLLNADGTISPEARRDLVLGVAGCGGNNIVVLVRREESGDDQDEEGDDDEEASSNCLVFSASAASAAAAAADARGAATSLSLTSHAGQGLVLSVHTRHVGSAPGLPTSGIVQAVMLGPAAFALPLVLEGTTLRSASDAERVLHVGQPEDELARRLGQELHSAAARGDIAAMQALLSAGADVNWVGQDSVGHVAAREGQLEALELLLSSGFEVNARAAGKGSPLIEAATFGRVACVQRLLAVKGVDLLREDGGKTALEWARDPSTYLPRSEAHDEVAALLEAAERSTLSGRIRHDVKHLVGKVLGRGA